jgi:hypothetical protein
MGHVRAGSACATQPRRHAAKLTKSAVTDLTVAAFVLGDHVLLTVSGSGRAQSVKKLIDLGTDTRRHGPKTFGN